MMTMDDESANFKRKSLRRALWQARQTNPMSDRLFPLDTPEREANLMLRERARQSLQEQAPITSIAQCPVYVAPNDWRRDVLRNDPEVVHASSFESLIAFLYDPHTQHILARAPMRSQLADLSHVPAANGEKSLYLEVDAD
jgi:hypothetical protein